MEEWFLQVWGLGLGLVASPSLILPPQHDFPTHKCLLHSSIFECVREYSQATCTLTPFSPTPMSFNTTSIFTILHHESDGFFPFSLENYELD